MNIYAKFGCAILILWFCLDNSVIAQVAKSNLSYVDPTIGGVGVLLEPTRPLAHLPNSMLRMHPQKRDQLDDQIYYFPLTITSHRISSVFSIMPFSGATGDLFWNASHTIATEKAKPHHYRVDFEDDNLGVEFAPSARAGVFKMDYKSRQNRWLRLTTLNANGELSVVDNHTLSGTENFWGMKAFFYAKINQSITDVQQRAEKNRKQVMLSFGKDAQPVVLRYGISFISIEKAKENLAKEIPINDFNLIKARAQQVWQQKLAQIQVTGGSLANKRVFYTALYRCYERMVNINEYGSYYSAYDKKVHQSNRPFYVDNWIWDNYIALEPLHTILNPTMQVDKINSYLSMYEQGGWMPSFALVSGDWPAMTGNHAASWITDSWFKGLRGFNLKTAYEGFKKNSLEATLLPWNNGPRTALDDFYNKNGYMPSLAKGEKETIRQVDTLWEKRQAVSVTLENSLSDWCIAQIANDAGFSNDRDFFMNRASFYKNVFNTEIGMVAPKNEQGRWIVPYNPKLSGREYFTENNAYTYNWHVKHDLYGLFDLMGGPKDAEAKLDQLFREDLSLPKWKFWNTQPDASGLVGQFVMGNEPSFHIPYLYNYMGAPWKTQKRIRMLLDTYFPDNLFGMPGDEDGGGMSAFVVFSTMGFFPVTPGIPIYAIGSPTFASLTIKLPNGKEFKLNTKNYAAENIFIQQATLNGKRLNRSWFTHTELVNGGVLELVMGSTPNKEWAVKKADLPPASVDKLKNYKLN